MVEKFDFTNNKLFSKIIFYYIFRMCAMVCLAQSDPPPEPSMYDLCRRKYSIQI